MKNIISGLIIGLAMVGMMACDEASFRQGLSESANKVTRSLIYTKDHRTNLCFAHANPYSSWSVMATVPCSPEVEKLIKD